jgi:3-deoxy-D-manno-octulosonic-acid transferase
VAIEFPALLTIIVPRHAARGDAIAADLRMRGWSVAQRSKHEPIQDETAIYLADTMGELGSFFDYASVVFIGGSLIAHGGHNPLEPARLHCALITGAHTHNFSSIFAHFFATNACLTVAHKGELTSALKRLLGDHLLRETLAKNAAQLVQHASGASATILRDIGTLLKAGAA